MFLVYLLVHKKRPYNDALYAIHLENIFIWTAPEMIRSALNFLLIRFFIFFMFYWIYVFLLKIIELKTAKIAIGIAIARPCIHQLNSLFDQHEAPTMSCCTCISCGRCMRINNEEANRSDHKINYYLLRLNTERIVL